ncbi:SMI1/KNR4 family protein [uncultured Aquimarina sp.]|uniref:SMI1/KNR4 family protein n=1 Tax=uncultured Aquimarina sp. TaxID=575652 RepID=UPI0026239629|nr:SMI1/KNR4 family protein [uncultured Aquimarina sp.]
MPFPVEEKYIIDTEKELEVTFPKSFRIRMMKLNGGEIENEEVHWVFYPFFDKSDKKRISRTSNHIVYETKEARNRTGFPKDAVAIGKDDYGNQIIMRPKLFNKKKLREAIYFWNHEAGSITRIAKIISEIR